MSDGTVWRGGIPVGKLDEILTKLDNLLTKLSGVLDVDVQATERTAPLFFCISTVTPPATIVVPSPGSSVTTRGVFLLTDSTSGTIFARYRDCGTVVGVVFASKFNYQRAERLNVPGGKDDPIIVTWEDLDPHSCIYAVITYKEE